MAVMVRELNGSVGERVVNLEEEMAPEELARLDDEIRQAKKDAAEGKTIPMREALRKLRESR